MDLMAGMLKAFCYKLCTGLWNYCTSERTKLPPQRLYGPHEQKKAES
jgi:hypothetical protein